MKRMPENLEEIKHEARGLVSMGRERFDQTPRGKLIKVKNVGQF